MMVRACLIFGLTVALAGCAKNAQETDALSPPPAARDTTRAATQRADSVRMTGDSTMRVKTDTVKAPAQ